MGYIDPPPIPENGTLARVKPYLVATALVLLAALVTYWLDWSGSLLIFFIPPVIYIIWRYRLAPAMFAVLLTGLCAVLLSYGKLHLMLLGAVRAAIYTLTMAALAWALNKHRREEESLILLQRHLLDTAHDPILMRDQNHCVIYWNAGAERLYGYSRSEAMGKRPHLLLQTPFEEERDEIFATQGFWRGELTRICKDGRKVVVASDWTRSANGFVLQTETDITERRRMEEELRQSTQEAQERLLELQKLNRTMSALSRSNQTLIHAVSRKKLLQDVTDIIVEQGGYTVAWVALPGESPHEAVTVGAMSSQEPVEVDELRVLWDESAYGRGPTGTALRTGERCVVQNILDDPQSSPWKVIPWFRRLGSAISLPLKADGRTVAALTVYSSQSNTFTENELKLLDELAGDLSFGLEALHSREMAELERRTRVALEEQFRQLQKMEAVGHLAGGIAHDFNNLLMVIIAHAELLTSQQLDEAIRRRGDGIMRAANSAAKLTKQLLAFSRKQVLQPTVQNLNEIAGGFQMMLERLVGETITVRTVLCPEPWDVCVDRTQIEQVLMNLVVNARDAMPNGGTLMIETANAVIDPKKAASYPLVPTGNYVMLAVSDTGTGMDEETRSRIFDPFFTTKQEGKGTGLGLSTVYGIVQQSGGYIWVYSEQGKGSCFKVYLPRYNAPTAAPEESGGSAAAQPQEREACILVVDDDNQLRELLCEFLASAGYHVLQASGVIEAEAQALAHKDKIDLLLTDVTLGNGNGRDLVNSLAAKGSAFEVLYMSGYTPDAIVHQGVLAEGMWFLQKPFSQRELIGKVAEVLAKRKASPAE
jgi:PAS domain S-box-containing protein